MDKDPRGTKYEFCGDIRHFYDSLQPEVVMDRMRQLIKDRRVLDLIWRVVKDGVQIGAYTSQWFANTVLQPMDRLIRESGLCKHYVRYMDNLTIWVEQAQAEKAACARGDMAERPSAPAQRRLADIPDGEEASAHPAGPSTARV